MLVLAGGGPLWRRFSALRGRNCGSADGFLACEGRVAALGVAAGDFLRARCCRAKTVALPEGIAPEDVESLNGLIL